MQINDLYLEVNLFRLGIEVKNDNEIKDKIKQILSKKLEIDEKNIFVDVIDKR